VNFRLLAVIVSTATLLSGCLVMVPGNLYPIQGPAATAQNPPAIYSVVINGIANSGTMTATLQNNESCSGAWNQVNQRDNSAGQMSAQWDQVYGPGFFVANVLGNPIFARAVLTCKQGTTLNIEFFEHDPGAFAGTKGIGQDSKGNLYKVTF
jgi:hypothetical protein